MGGLGETECLKRCFGKETIHFQHRVSIHCKLNSEDEKLLVLILKILLVQIQYVWKCWSIPGPKGALRKVK